VKARLNRPLLTFKLISYFLFEISLNFNQQQIQDPKPSDLAMVRLKPV